MQYIPKETLKEIISNLDISGIEAFFSTNRELYSLINEPDVLKYISDTKHLPYVSSMSNLVYFGRMTNKDLYKKALKLGDLRLVKHYIVKSKKDLNSAIVTAMEHGQYDIFQYLIGEGAELDDHAMDYSITGRNLDIIKYLVENGVEIDKYNIKATIEHGLMDIFKYFVSILGIDNIDKNIITYIVRNGSINFIKYLLKQGMDIDSGDKNVIEVAAKYGDLSLIKFLLKNGAGIGKNAVNKAAKRGNLNIVRYLISNGAHIRKNVISYAVESGNMDVVKYFESGGYTIKKEDEYVLLHAILSGSLDMVKYVHKKSPNVSSQHIIEASYLGDMKILKYLLGYIKKIDYKTLLYSANAALIENHIDMFRYIVSYAKKHGYKLDFEEMILDAIYRYAHKGRSWSPLQLIQRYMEEGVKITNNMLEMAITEDATQALDVMVGKDKKLIRKAMTIAKEQDNNRIYRSLKYKYKSIA